MGQIFAVTISIKLESVANLSEHWTKKSKRQRNQKKIIAMHLLKCPIKLPCKVKLTRVSPLELDEDNLISAFKHVKDCIADFLIPGKAPGRADSSKEIKWEFDQKKGFKSEFALNILMEQL